MPRRPNFGKTQSFFALLSALIIGIIAIFLIIFLRNEAPHSKETGTETDQEQASHSSGEDSAHTSHSQEESADQSANRNSASRRNLVPASKQETVAEDCESAKKALEDALEKTTPVVDLSLLLEKVKELCKEQGITDLGSYAKILLYDKKAATNNKPIRQEAIINLQNNLTALVAIDKPMNKPKKEQSISQSGNTTATLHENSEILIQNEDRRNVSEMTEAEKEVAKSVQEIIVLLNQASINQTPQNTLTNQNAALNNQSNAQQNLLNSNQQTITTNNQQNQKSTTLNNQQNLPNSTHQNTIQNNQLKTPQNEQKNPPNNHQVNDDGKKQPHNQPSPPPVPDKTKGKALLDSKTALVASGAIASNHPVLSGFPDPTKFGDLLNALDCSNDSRYKASVAFVDSFSAYSNDLIVADKANLWKSFHQVLSIKSKIVAALNAVGLSVLSRSPVSTETHTIEALFAELDSIFTAILKTKNYLWEFRVLAQNTHDTVLDASVKHFLGKYDHKPHIKSFLDALKVSELESYRIDFIPLFVQMCLGFDAEESKSFSAFLSAYEKTVKANAPLQNHLMAPVLRDIYKNLNPAKSNGLVTEIYSSLKDGSLGILQWSTKAIKKDSQPNLNVKYGEIINALDHIVCEFEKCGDNKVLFLNYHIDYLKALSKMLNGMKTNPLQEALYFENKTEGIKINSSQQVFNQMIHYIANYLLLNKHKYALSTVVDDSQTLRSGKSLDEYLYNDYASLVIRIFEGVADASVVDSATRAAYEKMVSFDAVGPSLEPSNFDLQRIMELKKMLLDLPSRLRGRVASYGATIPNCELIKGLFLALRSSFDSGEPARSTWSPDPSTVNKSAWERLRCDVDCGIGLTGSASDISALTDDNYYGKAVIYEFARVGPYLEDETIAGIEKIVGKKLIRSTDRQIYETMEWKALSQAHQAICKEYNLFGASAAHLHLPAQLPNLELYNFHGVKLSPTGTKSINQLLVAMENVASKLHSLGEGILADLLIAEVKDFRTKHS